MILTKGFSWGRKKRKLVQEAKEFMISETQKRPRTWHGMMTEEWMADFAEKKWRRQERVRRVKSKDGRAERTSRLLRSGASRRRN